MNKENVNPEEDIRNIEFEKDFDFGKNITGIRHPHQNLRIF